MRVLLLSPYPERLLPTFDKEGDTVTVRDSIYHIALDGFDFVVSYGHREIIPKAALEIGPPMINLHISLLPWNRGADPNLWSWIDNTPKGVTIHQIDGGIDTGLILIQGELNYFGLNPTLSSSYNQLQKMLESAFASGWKYIRSGECEPTPQSRGGTYHSRADRARVQHLLTQGWNTPVSQFIGMD